MSFFFKIKDAIKGRPYETSDVEGERSSYFSPPGVVPMAMPLRIKKSESEGEDKYWLLPWEPLISVSGSNVIAKRTVAKAKELIGTIKERLITSDWEIEIEGDFMNYDSLYYPEADVTRLKEYCIAKEPLDVLSPIFEALGISRIVIEDFEFPFTVGEENQKWKIKAVSDHDWNLFVAIK